MRIVDFGTGVVTNLNIAYQTISELSFLDNYNLIAIADGKLTKIPLPTPGMAGKSIPQKSINLKAGTLNNYAVDYNKQIYAVA